MHIINKAIWSILSRPIGLWIVKIVWFIWEIIENRLVPPYENIPFPYGIIRVRKIEYKRQKIVLQDETEIKPGVKLIELHLNNRVALDFELRGIHPYLAIRQDLAFLADWIIAGYKTGEYEPLAIVATSILEETLSYFKAEIHPWPEGFRSRIHEFFREGLLLIYHKNGRKRLNKCQAPIADGWISVRSFIGCYGSKPFPKQKDNRISVVVIARNEERLIEKCLNSLFCQKKEPNEIIVVLHNSTDRTAEIVESRFPRARLVAYTGPAGTIYARSRAFAEAKNDVVLCLDGDSYADPFWVEALSAPLLDHTVAAVTNPTYFHGNFGIWLASHFYFDLVHGLLNRPLAVFFKVRRLTFWGTSFACRKGDFENVGGFEPLIGIKPELLPGEWHEDFYLSLKLRHLGKIIITRKTEVHTQAKERSSVAFFRRFIRQQINEKRISELLLKIRN